jgi:hypothetical protein
VKPVPNEVLKAGPEGTVWFGGPVDRMKMSLRVSAKEPDWAEVSGLVGCGPDPGRGVWRVEAAASLDGNLDAQLAALLKRVTSDLAAWATLRSRWKVDVFCGLFLERPNRGVSLSAESMRLLSDRGISIGFDIYAPDDSRA